jgi:hypothetical protein
VERRKFRRENSHARLGRGSFLIIYIPLSLKGIPPKPLYIKNIFLKHLK